MAWGYIVDIRQKQLKICDCSDENICRYVSFGGCHNSQADAISTILSSCLPRTQRIGMLGSTMWTHGWKMLRGKWLPRHWSTWMSVAFDWAPHLQLKWESQGQWWNGWAIKLPAEGNMEGRDGEKYDISYFISHLSHPHGHLAPHWYSMPHPT